MNENIITIAITTGLSTLIFWLFSKFFPVNKSNHKTTKSIKELRKEFWKIDFLLLIVFLVLAPVFAYLSYKFFTGISDLIFLEYTKDGYLFLPERIMWLVPGLFAGLCVSSFLYMGFQKPILKGRYDDYSAYTNLKYGFDSARIMKFLIKFLIILITGFFILAINNFAHFGKDKIVISDFFQLTESTYGYSQIVEIKSVDKLVAPNGNIVENKYFVIDFNNNKKWSSRHGGNSNYDKDIEMINYILTKTGLELNYLEFDE